MNIKTIKAIYFKELKSFFYSPLAYIVITLFLIILGWFFTATLFINNGEASMRSAFSYIPILFLVFVPAITMRTIAEEKKSGTFELLVTMPIFDSEIIIAKYLASLSLIMAAVFGTLVYLITLTSMGNLDGGEVFGGYLGLFLMGGAYVSLGILASSLTENQIIAFILAFVFAFFFFIINKILMFMPAFLTSFLEYISIDYHFENIARGVIDTRDVIYYLSLSFLCLFLATKSLESRQTA